MNTNVTVVLGYQHCYLNPEGTFYIGEVVSKRILTKVAELSSNQGNGELLILQKMIRRADDQYFQYETTSCTVGSKDIEWPAPLARSSDWEKHIVTPRTNPLSNYSFMNILRRVPGEINSIALMGAETHRAVLQAASALREIYNSVQVLVEYTGSRDPYLHETALSIMTSSTGAELI